MSKTVSSASVAEDKVLASPFQVSWDSDSEWSFKEGQGGRGERKEVVRRGRRRRRTILRYMMIFGGGCGEEEVLGQNNL